MILDSRDNMEQNIKEMELLYKKFYTLLYRYAQTFLDDEDEAKDVVSDVFQRLWESWQQTEEHLDVSPTFLYTSVRNRCLDKLRHEKASDHYASLVKATESLASDDEIIEFEKRITMLRKAIDQLPAYEQMVLRSVYFQHLSYKETAALAKRAGFEMLMVHGGHGWLVNQFLSPYFNKRTDEYGGSLENRCRFAIEVLKAVREGVGPFFPIEFRMSGSELFEGGYDLEEGVRIAQTIEPYVDLIHVSAGTYQRGFGDTHPSMFKEHGCNVYLAAEIKKHVSIPVATIGGLNDPAQMEEIIASGKADIVYMARALLADPFLPRKVMENRENEIVKCLRCFTCMAERAATSTRRCTVNPLIGREIEGCEIQPAPAKKKVLVAGGGPGGLYAAYTAARRGHKVILCEKEAELGGILKSEQALPFKREMYELSNTYALFARNAGVEIRTSVEVTPEYVEKEAPDALIIAEIGRAHV